MKGHLILNKRTLGYYSDCITLFDKAAYKEGFPNDLDFLHALATKTRLPYDPKSFTARYVLLQIDCDEKNIPSHLCNLTTIQTLRQLAAIHILITQKKKPPFTVPRIKTIEVYLNQNNMKTWDQISQILNRIQAKKLKFHDFSLHYMTSDLLKRIACTFYNNQIQTLILKQNTLFSFFQNQWRAFWSPWPQNFVTALDLSWNFLKEVHHCFWDNLETPLKNLKQLNLSDNLLRYQTSHQCQSLCRMLKNIPLLSLNWSGNELGGMVGSFNWGQWLHMIEHHPSLTELLLNNNQLYKFTESHWDQIGKAWRRLETVHLKNNDIHHYEVPVFNALLNALKGTKITHVILGKKELEGLNVEQKRQMMTILSANRYRHASLETLCAQLIKQHSQLFHTDPRRCTVNNRRCSEAAIRAIQTQKPHLGIEYQDDDPLVNIPNIPF